MTARANRFSVFDHTWEKFGPCEAEWVKHRTFTQETVCPCVTMLVFIIISLEKNTAAWTLHVQLMASKPPLPCLNYDEMFWLDIQQSVNVSMCAGKVSDVLTSKTVKELRQPTAYYILCTAYCIYYNTPWTYCILYVLHTAHTATCMYYIYCILKKHSVWHPHTAVHRQVTQTVFCTKWQW